MRWANKQRVGGWQVGAVQDVAGPRPAHIALFLQAWGMLFPQPPSPCHAPPQLCAALGAAEGGEAVNRVMARLEGELRQLQRMRQRYAVGPAGAGAGEPEGQQQQQQQAVSQPAGRLGGVVRDGTGRVCQCPWHAVATG